MGYLDIAIEDRIAHIRLNRPKSNALHGPMLQELEQTLLKFQGDPAIRGIILQGKDGFFSSGLDLIELYSLNEVEVRAFWTQFVNLIKTFLKFDKPAVAAITGHSPAGGCVLALCCDYRIMADGDFIIGLNELPVGIVVPESIFNLYSFWIGSANAYRSLLEGKLFTPKEALAIGLLDEVVPQNMLISTSERTIRKLVQFEAESWSKSKMHVRRGLLKHFENDQDPDLEAILEQWWKPSTRQLLKSIIDNLKVKS